MTLQAQSAHVGEIARPAVFPYRNDMVGIPQVPAAAPLLFESPPRGVIELAFVHPQLLGIDTAFGAHTAVAREYLVAQVAGVGAQLPFMHARGAAERQPTLGNFGAAPAARVAFAGRPTSWPGAQGAHTRSS